MKKQTSIIPLLIITVTSMIIGMWLFQKLKFVILPSITIGQSHAITIIFNTILATVVVYLIVRKREVLVGQLLEEIRSRKEAEIALQRQRELLRELSARLSEVEENERKRLAAELHDLVGQNLTALGINLNIISDMMPADLSQPVHTRMQDSMVIVNDTIESIRDVITDLRPSTLDDFGLTATIQWYGELFFQRTGIAITMQMVELSTRLPAHTENAVFRIFQESLTNIQKHAQASEVRVSLEEEKLKVRLLIRDNGIGFDAANMDKTPERKGWGLVMMTERAMEASGSFSITSQPGQGTQIAVEVNR
jgi:signal transduction histidine kinase